MKKVIWIFVGIVFVAAVILAAAIGLSGPKAPAGVASLAAPFRTMDFKTLPPASFYTARDGVKLAFRAYPAAEAKQAVVLIHGSTASSTSMHAMAEHLRQNNMDVYALDIRGHGDSSRRGDIDYVGQLEDDLEDFMTQFFSGRKDVTLVGFSAGGGFVLRFAAGDRQGLFGRYVALAPFLRYDAPTTRPGNNQHAKASVPRIAAISFLGAAGQKYFGHLPVVAFGVSPDLAKYLTPTYSYRLWTNFSLHQNYKADLRAIKQHTAFVVGENDELFYPQKYLTVLADVQPHAEIRIVPEVGHTTLTTDPAGMEAIADVLQDRP